MLARLGWDEGWETARQALDPDSTLQAVRIVAEHRGAYHATAGEGVAWVELTGKTYHQAHDKRELPTVGDWVLVERFAEALAGGGAATIRHILPRRGLLVRKAAGEATLPQPVAANVDLGIVMTSANSDLSPARLDRYLTLLRDGGIEPVLVLSKIDLVDDPVPLLAAMRAVAPDAAAFGISSVRGDGVEQIRALAGPGKTLVLLGSSGVGKSSLLNALHPGLALRTQEISASVNKGRHTTVGARLIPLPDGDGGYLVDTPGLREVGMWGLPSTSLDQCFPEFKPYLGECRFQDCQHEVEPGCAIRQAVETGTVDSGRYESYVKLRGEIVASENVW